MKTGKNPIASAEPEEALRIALVFPPAMPPASPPLGIASLKAYLGSSKGLEVRNFDLNLAYFDQAFQWLADGRLRMRLGKMDFKTTARKAAAAKDFFCGKDGLAGFFDLASYNEQAATYAGFSSVLNGLFENFARKLLAGLVVPPLAKNFFGDLITPVEDFRPHLIGFSVLFSQQLFFALALAKLCGGTRRRSCCGPAEGDGAPKIVLGGATFSVMPDPGRLLAGPLSVNAGGEQRQVDLTGFIDGFIVGEGERGLESFARLAASGAQRPADVPGLIRIGDGAMETTPPAAISDLDILPLPDFSDFPLEKYHSPVTVLPFLSSRGCPWRRCAFCTHQKTYLDYREEDAGVAAGKLFALKETYGAGHFCLVDEMVHPRRMDRIAAQLIRRCAGIHFSAYARPSRFSPRIIERAHSAGLRLLMWGLESSSRRLLDLMCKGTDAKEIAATLAFSARAGVWNLVFLIFGFPTETRAEWLDTMDFVESCRDSIHALSRSRFILLEGSQVFRKPHRYGIKRIMDRPERDPVSIAFDYEVSEGLTQEEAADMFRESLARLSGVGRSPWFGQFREHMLLFASRTKPGPGED
jgi:radical SAM superfamily enzyme YgiQ (UPF0313 family)